MTQEEYFDSIIESLEDKYQFLLEHPHGCSDKEIKDLAHAIDLTSLYYIKFPFGLRLYRARYNEHFKDDSDANEYSYIHNPAIPIRQLRYNLSEEKVLYTASSPDVAFEEIRDPNKTVSQFYLSIWQPKQGVNLTGSCIFDPRNTTRDSNARKYSDILEKNIGANTYGYSYLKAIGQLMEISTQDYRFSAELASRILTRADYLLTISNKSEGKELNLTFNQNATDNKLDLLYVLLCDVPIAPKPFFNVHKVGKNIKGKIVWFDFRLRAIQDLGCSPNLISAMQANPNIIGPSSIKSIDETTHKMKIEVDNQFSFDYVLY